MQYRKETRVCGSHGMQITTVAAYTLALALVLLAAVEFFCIATPVRRQSNSQVHRHMQAGEQVA
jgi:hypothetical protein